MAQANATPPGLRPAWALWVIAGAVAVVVAGGLVLWRATGSHAAPNPPALVAAPGSPVAAPPTPPHAEPAAAPTRATYTADLDKGERPIEFSDGHIEFTHKGHRPMLGRFGDDGFLFTLDELPPHEVAHVTVDLAFLNSWNGSSPIWGPDIWGCDEGDDRPLYDGTFSNCGFFSNNNEQSYPDLYPLPPGSESHPAWTGSAEHQTLGEMRRFAHSEPATPQDCSSVYHLDWTFPHTNPVLELRFTSKQHDKNLRWAILGLHAEVVAQAPHLSAEAMRAALADLNDADPVKADVALWRLAATGDAAVDALRSTPAPPDASPYRVGRVTHLLQVIGSPAATAMLHGGNGTPP